MAADRCMVITSLLVYLVSMLLLLIGFATPYWTWIKVGEYEKYSGLWVSCRTTGFDTYGESRELECENTDLNTQPAWMETVVAFLILALLMGLAAGCLYVIMPATAGLQVASGLCVIIAIGIWAAKEEEEGVSTNFISWSFGLVVTSGVLFLLNGGFLAYIANTSRCRCTPEFCIGKEV